MKSYRFEVITSVLIIEAENEEQAETKYDVYWTAGEELCPCGVKYCGCVEYSEETYHTITEEANA